MKTLMIIIALIACQACSSVSFKTDKASIEVEGKKAEVEGLELKTEKAEDK